MGGVNKAFADKLAGRNPHPAPPFVATIIQVEHEDRIPGVLSGLSGIRGVSGTGHASSFIRAVVPSELVGRVASLPGVVTVSADAPVKLGSSPRIIDPFYGQFSISAIEIPVTPGEMAARFALTLPLGIAGLGAWFGRLASGSSDRGWSGPSTNVTMVPTGETIRWLGIDEADRSIRTKVAVLDTGITFPHVLLHPSQGMIRAFSVTGEPPIDGLGHGQWCSTTAFGNTFPSRFGKLAGVAPTKNGALMHVKCLGNLGFGSTFGIIKACEMAADHGSRVVSMSLGGPQQGSVDEDPLCQCLAGHPGVIFVVAAGNEGAGDDGMGWTIGSPGISPNAITVGSWSTVYDGPSIFSSRGPSGPWYKKHPSEWSRDLGKYGDRMIKPDIMAPGGGPVEKGDKVDLIYSGDTGWTDAMYDLTPGDGLEGMRGTSMACPHAAGLVAYAVDRGLLSSAQDVKFRMARGSQKNTVSGYGFATLARLKKA